jgi:hypothetical protein
MELQLVATLSGFIRFNGCHIYIVENHQAMTFPKYSNSMPKCQKIRRLHKIENCGLGATYVAGWDMLKKNVQSPKTRTTTNFFEVLVDDEKAILAQLNRIVVLTMMCFFMLRYLKEGYP